jgi:hypothetical protein
MDLKKLRIKNVEVTMKSISEMKNQVKKIELIKEKENHDLRDKLSELADVIYVKNEDSFVRYIEECINNAMLNNEGHCLFYFYDLVNKCISTEFRMINEERLIIYDYISNKLERKFKANNYSFVYIKSGKGWQLNIFWNKLDALYYKVIRYKHWFLPFMLFILCVLMFKGILY